MKWKGFVGGALVVTAGLLLRGPVAVRRAPARADGEPIRVEVLNGSGVHRAGQGLAEALREMGFDVVDVRNAERSDYEKTLVVDRLGEPRYAARVAEKLGVEATLQEVDRDLLLEVTVILGRDLAPGYGEGG